MELRHLRYFVCVAEEQNLTRAATMLGIKQPPLGQQIRALETELGMPLFDRSPKRIKLNAAGQVFLAGARKTLAVVEDSVRQVRRFDRGEQGSISVGFTSSASFHPLTPHLIRNFRAAYPLANLEVEEQETYRLIVALEERRLDIAILRTPTDKYSHIKSLSLADEPIMAAVPIKHAMAHRRFLSLNDIAEEGFVAYRRQDGPGIFHWLEHWFTLADLQLSVVDEVPRMIAAINLVAAGRGISLVPSCMRVLHQDAIAYVPLRRGAMPNLALNLVYRADNELRLVQNFASVARTLKKR